MGLFSKKQDQQLSFNQQPEVSVKQEETKPVEVITEFDENHVTHFFPRSYDETKQIVDTLIRFKNVTVKLTDIEKEDKKRLIDFLTGVMYALDGDYKKIDNGVYYFWINN
ncbi:cell division protein SepF [Spiroplasma sp. BIUS-1]|uniref:cell division protein SepF n=1 Tax=Spiroplasma sp. BIUS-1 TaxID=216964 RepID=UPI0013979E0B|nr:cell division protein SepF [Spiroplasma sp. BIUS-1]QHX36862.1 cell division inhibitor SepF [Spiroplasma sp. BIUS-1]